MRIRFKVSKMQEASGFLVSHDAKKKTDKIFTRTEAQNTLFKVRTEAQITLLKGARLRMGPCKSGPPDSRQGCGVFGGFSWHRTSEGGSLESFNSKPHKIEINYQDGSSVQISRKRLQERDSSLGKRVQLSFPSFLLLVVLVTVIPACCRRASTSACENVEGSGEKSMSVSGSSLGRPRRPPRPRPRLGPGIRMCGMVGRSSRVITSEAGELARCCCIICICCM